MEVVYFAEHPPVSMTIRRFDQQGTSWEIPIIQCERCASLVLDIEESRRQHESFHRGWWVKPEESE